MVSAAPDPTDSVGCVSAPSSPTDAESMERLIERCKARAKQERLTARLARLKCDLTSSLRDAEEALLYTRSKREAASIEIESAYLRKVNDELRQISEALSPRLGQSSLLDMRDATQSLDLVQSVDEGEEFQYARSRHFIASSSVPVAPDNDVDIAAWDRIDASCDVGSGARLPVPATWNSPSSSAEPFQTQQHQGPTAEVTSRKKLTWFDGGETDSRISAMTERNSHQTLTVPDRTSGPCLTNDQFSQSEQFDQNVHVRGSVGGGRSTRTRSSGMSEWWCNLDDESVDDNNAEHAKLFMEQVHRAQAQPDIFKTIWGDQEMSSLSPNAEQAAAYPCLSQDTNNNGPAEQNRSSSIPYAANTYIKALLHQVAGSGDTAEPVSPGDAIRQQILAKSESEPHPEPQSVRTLFKGLLFQSAASSPPFASSSPISSAGPEQAALQDGAPSRSESIATDAGIEQRLMRLENVLQSTVRAPAVTKAPCVSLGSRIHRPWMEASVDEAQLKHLSLVEAALSSGGRASRNRKTEPPRGTPDSNTWNRTSAATTDTIEIGNVRCCKTDILQASLGTQDLTPAPGARVAEMAVSVETVTGYHLDLALASSSATVENGSEGWAADTVRSHYSQS